MDINTIKTKSGKTVQDFTVSDKLKTNESELVVLILRSEAMNDQEKQYWFTLTDVMNKDQMDKLYDILRRERKKLDEIDVKYGKKPAIDHEEAQIRANKQAEQRKAHQEDLRQKEAAFEREEDDEAILAGFDNI